MADLRSPRGAKRDIVNALLGPNSERYRLYDGNGGYHAAVESIAQVLPLFMEFLAERAERDVADFNERLREMTKTPGPGLRLPESLD